MSEVRSIPRIVPPWPFEAYAHIISPLPEEDGGGYLITFPDLPGCMADGETEIEAVKNGRDAFIAVVSALADMGRVFRRRHSVQRMLPRQALADKRVFLQLR